MAEFVPTSYFAKAVSGTLRAGLQGFVVHDFDEMTEAIHDTPLLSVYPWGDQADIATATDRTTFGGALIQSQLIIRADLFAQQRSNLGEDMGALVGAIDQMELLLTNQSKPLFGAAEIKSMEWGWVGIVFEYGAQNKRYSGARFIINLRMF